MLHLKAGNIDLFYENGFIRQFKVKKTEVLRMIYFAIRDTNWGNLSSTISDEKIEHTSDTFSINYKVKYFENSTAVFEWQVEIKGQKTSEISFEIEGKALRDFKTNRAGFCVLHPIENISGERLSIEHTDGGRQNYVFPENISAHQPFFDIKGMAWKVNDSKFELDFEGEVFETEDQRNWGDASYKTYCTPQRLPFPKPLYAGDVVHQKVNFKLITLGNEGEKSKDIFEENKVSFSLGICENSTYLTIPNIVISNIRSLNLSHYRTEVNFSIDWEPTFKCSIEKSQNLKLALDLNLFLSENYKEEISIFFEKYTDLPLKYLTLLSNNQLVTEQTLIDYIPYLKNKLIDTQIGIGTQYNFTEINRNRFDAASADFISMSFSPTEHAIDDLTIIENAETVKYLVDSTKAMYNKPVHLSPIALKRRYNPYATDKNAINISIENQLDERQKTAFLAQWTKVLISNLIASGVASVSLFKTHGELGIMNDEGGKYPVFEELKGLQLNDFV